jgi:hypothetical protein
MKRAMHRTSTIGSTFTGAALPVCGIDVLVVVVRPWILADAHEAALYIVAFQLRFQRMIVLMAQDDARVPTYYGPAAIVHALCALPFEIIPWQPMHYKKPRPRSWQLPIPPEPEPAPSTSDLRCSPISGDDTEELAQTRVFDRAEAERSARTTSR